VILFDPTKTTQCLGKSAPLLTLTKICTPHTHKHTLHVHTVSHTSSTSFLVGVDNSHDLQKTNVECLEEGGKRNGERETGEREREEDRNGRRDEQVRGREKQCYQSSREWERRVETVLERCFTIYTRTASCWSD